MFGSLISPLKVSPFMINKCRKKVLLSSSVFIAFYFPLHGYNTLYVENIMRTKYDGINKNEGGFAYKDHSRDWHMLNFGEEIPFGTELTHCETYNTVCVIV